MNWAQLLREQWFPATLSCPQTAFTFDSLETFHELMLQGKMNVYDYYNTLIQRFDNANIATPIVSSVSFHLFQLIFIGLYNRSATQRSTAYFVCGGTWWLWSEPVVAMIWGVSTQRWRASWWWNVRRVLTLDEIFLMIGRMQDHYCKLSIHVSHLSLYWSFY